MSRTPPPPPGAGQPWRPDGPPPPPGAPTGQPGAHPPAARPVESAGDDRSEPPGSQRTRTRTPLTDVPSPYGLWIATFSVLIFIAPNLLVLVVGGLDAVEPVPADAPRMIVLNLVVGLVLQMIVFGLALLPVLAAGRPFSRLWGPTRTTGAMVAIGLATGVVVAIIAFTLNAIVALLAGVQDPVEQQLLQDALAGGLPLLLVAVLAVVVAPLVEEIIFRGVLFRALADRINLAVGLVLSSAIFTLIHVEIVFSQPFALVGLFTVGFLLALAYQLTGNLMVAILGHAVFNAISLGLTLLIDRLDLEELLDLELEAASLVGWLPPVGLG